MFLYALVEYISIAMITKDFFRQGQGFTQVGSTTGAFTSFGTSLQRNQAFTSFGQQRRQPGQNNQAFTIFGQNHGQNHGQTVSFTSFGPSPTTPSFGRVGSPPATAIGSIFRDQQHILGGGLQSSFENPFVGHQPVSQELTVARNQVGSSPNSSINFG